MKMTRLQENIFECLEQGLKTKEIMEKLSCSVDSVKQTRANKELKAFYDSQKKEEAEKDPRNIMKFALTESIKAIREIARSSEVNLSEKLTASKQLLDLTKAFEELFPAPKEKRTIEIKYVGAKPWQLQEKAKLEIECNKENILAELKESIKKEFCEVCER